MLSYVNFVNNKREILQMYFVLFILSNMVSEIIRFKGQLNHKNSKICKEF